MNEIVRQDILKVLQRTIAVLKKPSPVYQQLNNLSNNTIHDVSIFQDKYSITTAIAIYSLYKIFSRGHKKKNSPFTNEVLASLESMESDLQKEDLNAYESHSKELMEIITQADKNTKEYIQEVIEKARITKASKMYAHGISLQQTANLLGVTIWQMERYIGHTHIPEKEECLIDPLERLTFAEDAILPKKD